jgi:DMSO/TMAO reductase YedYZ molybdopterin-dependent catalytic subunit
MEFRPILPKHPIPEEVLKQQSPGELRVEGLVARPLVLNAADLAGLPRVELVEPFVCEEGWQTPAQTWRGVRLLDVIALAKPEPGPAWVRVSSGEYAVPLSMDHAAEALLAERLNGEPLGPEHGGPWRLVVPGSSCFTSAKWVDRLELAAKPGEASGEAIARARLKSNGARDG